MSEVIRPTDPGVLERCRAAGTAWVELAPEDREVYERIHLRLEDIAKSANAIANKTGSFKHRLTSRFTLNSGVGGSQPKDLWFGLYPEHALLGMPQLYMIASARGVEYGFAPAIHPSDFSSQSYKRKLRVVIATLFAALPDPDSLATRELSQNLESTGGWYFRRKARLDPFQNDFPDIQALIEFLRSREGLKWGAGSICRYVQPEQLNDSTLDLKLAFENVVGLFSPFINQMRPASGAAAVIGPTSQGDADGMVDDIPQGDVIGPGLEKFLQTYGSIRHQPFKRDDGLWGMMNHLSDQLSEIPAVQNRPNIMVKWSVGKGNWAPVPHISFLDQRETTTTQRGLYGVFLFREDLSGVYLTLNQGVTEFTKNHSHSEARKILKDRANQFGKMVSELTKRDFLIDSDIDLKTEGDLGLDYEASTIAYKLYSRGAVPSDAEISADLDQLLECYERILNTKESTRKSWIFQANPEYFNIDGAIAELDEVSWLVNQHAADIHEGDEVFLWRSGPQGGIVASGMVLTEPLEFVSPPEESKFNVVAEKFKGPRTRVRIALDELVNPVLSRAEIINVPNFAWDQNWYRRVIETEIIPLLSEYWFDDDDRVAEWRGRLLGVA
jgi:MrcB-like, N-terminal domain/EVE domain